MYVCIYISINVYTYVYMDMYIQIYVYIDRYIYIYIRTYIYTYINIYMHMIVSVRSPLVQIFDCLLLLLENLQMTFWQKLIKSPKTKRFCFGRFILGWSNADEQPLSFGSRKEHSVSIYLPLQKIATNNKTLRFGRFDEILSKGHFCFFPEEQKKIKELDPWCSNWRLSYISLVQLRCMVVFNLRRN